ncbi:hypothetical protein L0U85_09360 [Glycomyces sp. L485]|uniref:hypothetical protein n=1 Tax=Glycomyces sp. L485 TaxID=2909235 RepID=UPI001F4AD5B0|nr:hypothetical protein [Glycomyces sp. L485]MCH7231057.1 hypothetical protein [Glycomyces sp. L485]
MASRLSIDNCTVVGGSPRVIDVGLPVDVLDQPTHARRGEGADGVDDRPDGLHRDAEPGD